MKNIVLIIFIILFSACNSSESKKAFAPLDGKEATIEEDGEVVIESVTPNTSTIDVFTSKLTFAVSLAPGAGTNVKFKFLLDGFEVQNTTSPFFILDSAVLTPKIHSLKVIASNTLSSDEHTFNLYKNTPPTLTLVSSSSLTVACNGGSFNMQVSAVDEDNDSVTFKFLVNGLESVTGSSGTSSSTMATHSYTPNCIAQGVQQVSIKATDARGGEATFTLGVTVVNPNVVSINYFAPTGNPVVIKSTESTNFIISATGSLPLSYVWSITPGSTIASCANNPNCSISGGDFSPGAYILQANVTDAVPSTASQSFNVVLNAKPSISFKSPSVINKLRMNCSGNKNFQITIADPNYSDPGQSMTVTWTIDNAASANLGVTTDTLTYPYTSVATFSPNCSASLLGEHVIKVTVSDGHEETTTSWNVQTNYFPDTCNDILNDSNSASNFSRGKICTLAGLPGLSNGVDTVLDPAKVKIRPLRIELYNPVDPRAYFITDASRHLIWFYNGTTSDISVLGKTIAPNKLIALVGNGAIGVGSVGQSYNNFYLSMPRAIHYDRTEDKLYIADYGNHRIVMMDNSGYPTIFAGGGTSETDGAANTGHRCLNPYDMVRDGSEIIVTCFQSRTAGQGNIKRFSLTSFTGTTLVKFVNDNNVVEGTLGKLGTAGVSIPFAMVKHPTEKILFAADNGAFCRLYAINYGSSSVTIPGISVTVPAGELRRITMNVGCPGTVYPKLWSDTTLRVQAYGLGIRTNSSTGVFEGLYLIESPIHSISLFNLSSGTINFSGRTISPGNIHQVIGNANQGYSRTPPTYSGTSLWAPYHVMETSAGLMVLDYGNGKISLIDSYSASATNPLVDILGTQLYFGYDGNVNKLTTTHHLYNPTSLTYDPNKDRLLFYDSTNNRLRSIDLTKGTIDVVVGNGDSGTLTADPAEALGTDFKVRHMRDLAMVPDEEALVYSDANAYVNVTGPIAPPNANNQENCAVRLWNFGTTSIPMAGFNIDVNRVKNIAGNRGYGCGHWRAEYEGRYSTDVALSYPLGVVATPDGNVFTSNWGSHCINKINGSTGVISTQMGLCGSAVDNVMGPFSVARFNNPGALELDSDPALSAAGNFFIVDSGGEVGSSIKYANFSSSTVSIAGSDPIPSGSVGRLLLTDGYTSAVTSFDSQICYAQGSGGSASANAQNVICVSRDTGAITLRVGRASASIIKGFIQLDQEEEGVAASSSSLYGAYGLAFDSEGNLYITDTGSHTIRMVKKWW